MKRNVGERRIGALSNQGDITTGDETLSSDPKSDAIDGFTQLNDVVEWRWMTEQFEVSFRSYQADLNCPAQK